MAADSKPESPAETPPPAATVFQPVGLPVNELWLASLRHAIPHAVMNETIARGILSCKSLNRGRVENKSHYVKNGKPTSEVDSIKLAMRPLIDLYGVTPANDFGPLSLNAPGNLRS